jgi:hypothetical protein
VRFTSPIRYSPAARHRGAQPQPAAMMSRTTTSRVNVYVSATCTARAASSLPNP